MGLTIHYDFETNKKTTDKQAERIMNDLWQFANTLKQTGALEEVSELFYINKEDIEYIRGLSYEERNKHPLGWAAIQCTERLRKKVSVGKNSLGKHIYKDVYKEIYPEEGWLFTTWPGEGSEEANFGLMRYPTEVTLTEGIYDHRVAQPLDSLVVKTGFKHWSWSSFCKTQYASTVGLAHFAKCHIAVCTLLDHIYMNDRLNLEVSDEGEFWEKRNVPALIREVGDWNRMIASFTGALLDAKNTAGFEDLSIEAPIMDHPSFEVLETEGHKELHNKTAINLMSLLSDVLKLKEVEGKLPKEGNN